jgi:hypothetical protein
MPSDGREMPDSAASGQRPQTLRSVRRLAVRRLTVRDVTLGRNRYADHDYPVDTNWIFGVVPKDMLE